MPSRPPLLSAPHRNDYLRRRSPPMPAEKQTVKLTPPQVARRYHVSKDKILSWIRSGELRALNIATSLGGRPRYVIDEADLAAFEAKRSAVPALTPTRRRKKTSG